MCLEFSHVALPGLKQLYDAYSFNVIPQIGRSVLTSQTLKQNSEMLAQDGVQVWLCLTW